MPTLASAYQPGDSSTAVRMGKTAGCRLPFVGRGTLSLAGRGRSPLVALYPNKPLVSCRCIRRYKLQRRTYTRRLLNSIRRARGLPVHREQTRGTRAAAPCRGFNSAHLLSALPCTQQHPGTTTSRTWTQLRRRQRWRARNSLRTLRARWYPAARRLTSHTAVVRFPATFWWRRR